MKHLEEEEFTTMEVNLSSFLEEDDQVQQQEEQLHHSCSPNDVTIEEGSAPTAISTKDRDGPRTCYLL